MRIFSAIVRLVLIIAVTCFVFGVSRSFVADAQEDQTAKYAAPAR
jgi:hypothetical protein